MPERPDSALEEFLRRDRWLLLLCLLALCALAWAYVVSGARMGASAWEMTSFALFPHAHSAGLEASMAGMDMRPTLDLGSWALLAGMWVAMMVAMMAPAATPAILLYGRVHRHSLPLARAPVASFALGYLAMWSAVSLLLAALQLWLERLGTVSTMSMGLHNRWAAGSLLVLAGLYQFTPLKHACLAHCRSPVSFLTTHFRAGAGGAFVLGLRHGAYCVGCCWLLMALLFVGGVMNLAWIGAIGALVLLEKLAAPGRAIGIGVGLLLIAWGIATFFVR